MRRLMYYVTRLLLLAVIFSVFSPLQVSATSDVTDDILKAKTIEVNKVYTGKFEKKGDTDCYQFKSSGGSYQVIVWFKPGKMPSKTLFDVRVEYTYGEFGIGYDIHDGSAERIFGVEGIMMGELCTPHPSLSYEMDGDYVKETIEIGSYKKGKEVGLSFKGAYKGNYKFKIVKKVKTYTIKYNLNGGTGKIKTQKKIKGKNLKLSKEKPTRDGYVFLGWSTKKNGKVVYNPGAVYKNNKNLTLYAVWFEGKVVKSKYYDGIVGKELTAKAIYTDTYFTKKSTKVQGQLARLSMLGSAAAYDDNKNEYSKSFLKSCGFKGFKRIKNKGSDGVQSSLSYKDIGGNKVVLAILIRGTAGGIIEKEWQSNLKAFKKNKKVHEGFGRATSQLYDDVQVYIKDHSDVFDNKEIVYWITGHSRGAAVGNLLAARLTDLKGQGVVYAYTFATPNVSKEAQKDNYENIFNFLNNGDPVTKVPQWGHKRYGVDKTLDPKKEPGTKKIYVSLTGLALAKMIKDNTLTQHSQSLYLSWLNAMYK